MKIKLKKVNNNYKLLANNKKIKQNNYNKNTKIKYNK